MCSRRRLEIVRGLLRETELSIESVGNGIGFTNAGAFATAYRRRFGHPPRAERGHGAA